MCCGAFQQIVTNETAMRSTQASKRRFIWLSPRPLASAICARGRLLLLISLTVFGVLAALIFALPKEYQSRMELLVMSGAHDDLPVASSEDTKTAQASYAHEVLLNSEIELLRSTDVLTKVVLKTGLQKLEASEDQSAGESSPLTIERALVRLRQNLKITPIGKSNVVEVVYTAFSPELAHDVLKALAATYPERRIEVHSEPGAYKFLLRQSVAWRSALSKAEEDLVRCRRMYSGFVLPEERAAFLKRALDAQAAAEQADAQVAEYEQKVNKQQKELEQYLPSKVAYSDGAASPRFIRVQYPAGSPGGNSAATLDIPDLSALKRDFLANQAELSGLQALRDRLKQVAERYRKETYKLAGVTIQHDALLRQVKEREDHYLLYSRKQEETRIAEALARGKATDVSVADGPTYPVEPCKPQIPEDLLMALLCSFACGIAVVLMVEIFTPGQIRTYAAVKSVTADQLERRLL